MISKGMLMPGALEKARLRKDEFFGELRVQGVRRVGEVENCFLGRNGQISIFRFEKDTDSTMGESTFPEDYSTPKN